MSRHLLAFACSIALGGAPSALAQSAPSKPAAPAAAPSGGTAAKGTEASKAARQIFILPQSGMVGVGLRAAEMEKVEKAADKFGPGQIIVLRINSPGGLVTEADEIDKVLNRVREKHRLVAWLEEAISAAAVMALHCR